jgi:hypothetical protein
LFTPLRDKYFAKIIDITKQLIYSCLFLFRFTLFVERAGLGTGI